MDDLKTFVWRELKRSEAWTSPLDIEPLTRLIRVESLHLRRTTKMALASAGIDSLAHLASLSPEYLATLPGFRLSMVVEIGEALVEFREHLQRRRAAVPKNSTGQRNVGRNRTSRSSSGTRVTIVSTPFELSLSQIPSVYGRLVVLALSVAYEEKGRIIWARLREFAEGARVPFPKQTIILQELARAGLRFSAVSADFLLPVTPLEVRTQLGDLPGRLLDREFLRAIWFRVGVIRQEQGTHPPATGGGPAVSAAGRSTVDPTPPPIAPTSSGSFDLNQVTPVEARLLAFTLALAANQGLRVNFSRLCDFTSGARLPIPVLNPACEQLRQHGFVVDAAAPERMGLTGKVRIELDGVNLPGRVADVSFVLPLFRRVGVLVP